MGVTVEDTIDIRETDRRQQLFDVVAIKIFICQLLFDLQAGLKYENASCRI